ncbi:MAG TPA: hypothetical protein VHY37_01280 [Tepidisphaeraceae bacterium]|nr:hypothetical protein [Tepidisphaeraceae bacterium]
MAWRRIWRIVAGRGAPCAAVGALALATACFATEYHSVIEDRSDIYNVQYSWANPKNWQTADKTNGVPATAQDVGIISAGHGMTVWDPLGTSNNRPTIRVEKGGTLFALHDVGNPLVLAGGTLNAVWFGKTVQSSLAVTADSTILTQDEWGAWQMNIDGTVSNPSAVTLHINGTVLWHTDSSKTFSGAIDVDRGVLGLVNGRRGSSSIGTGPIQLTIGAVLDIAEQPGLTHYPLTNDLGGDGTIKVGTLRPDSILVDSASLHPGMPDEPGILCIRGSLEFQRKAGKPVQLVIEVHGNGTSPHADYSQVAVLGNLTNSLENADLILRLKPDMTAEQAADLRLDVITAQGDNLTQPNVNIQPFHTVQVIAGNRTGTATAKVIADPLTGGDTVEVSDIRLK